MITLETGQEMCTDTEWTVVTGGDYQPNDLVVVSRKCDPFQTVSYYAQFIATGVNP